MKNFDLVDQYSQPLRDWLERIHQSIQEEDAYEKDNNYVAVCHAGLQTWFYLKQFMNFLGAKDFCDLEGYTRYDLLYWSCRLTHHLHNTSLKDKSLFPKKFLFCKEYVEMHENYLNKNMRNLGSIRQSLADCYVERGNFKICDTLYEQWLKKEPDWGWGWISWSDCYWLFYGKNKPNLIKAKHILEKGLAVQGVSDKDYISERFKELENKILASGLQTSSRLAQCNIF